MAVLGESSARGAVDPVEPELARSIRSWMRAYPCRWRAERGEEMFGLVADLARPGARRLGARSSIDLLRGGWATRWRERPPLHNWLLYRLFDKRIPVAYRVWALDDIDGYWYPLRRGVGRTWWLMLNPGIFRDPVVRWLWPLSMVVVCAVMVRLAPEADRRRPRLKHLAARVGERVFPGALVQQDVPRRRATARSALAWSVLLLGVVAAASVTAAVFASKGVHAVRNPAAKIDPTVRDSWILVVGPLGAGRVVAVVVLTAALGAGLFCGLVARRHLCELLGQRFDQPRRVLGSVSPGGRFGVLLWAALIVALAWAEVTGHLVLSFTLPLGAGALVLLPGAVVALGVSRRADVPDLAGLDVWWIAARGRVAPVDRPASEVRPLAGQYPEGVVVQPRRFGDPSYPALP